MKVEGTRHDFPYFPTAETKGNFRSSTNHKGSAPFLAEPFFIKRFIYRQFDPIKYPAALFTAHFHNPGFSQTSSREHIAYVRLWVWRSEPGDNVSGHVEVGE